MLKKYGSIRIVLSFFLIFAIGGFLHVFFYSTDWATSLFQLYYCIIVLLWGNALRRRIIEKRTRKQLTAIVTLLIMLFVLQAGRFAIFNYTLITRRYVWYAYYMVYTCVACLFLQVAIDLNHGEDDKKKPISVVLYMLAFLECLIVFSNDLHEMFFAFPDGLANADSSYEYGFLYYVVMVLEPVYYLIALVIIFLKCRIAKCRKKIWMPIIFATLGCMGIALSYIGKSISINGIKIWADGDIFSFLVMGIIESCIEIGLIPSNIYYDGFFRFVNDPVLIRDNDSQIRYATSSAQNGIVESEDVRVYTKEISGGTVSYGVDISAINKLNRDLDEATERVKIRNEYLVYQNDLKEEQLKLQTRNEIYDKIAAIVKPELEETLTLVENPNSEDFNKKLAKIAFYNAYIKRRSNMELLSEESPFLSVKELSSAVCESIEYLKLSGVQGMARITGWQELPANMVTLFYDFFQYVIEKCIDSLSEVFVTLNHKDERDSLSLVLKTEESSFNLNWKKDEIVQYDGKITVSCEEDGTVISISMGKGGNQNDHIR